MLFRSLSFGLPATSAGEEYVVVEDLPISEATQAGIDSNIKVLMEEYDAVKAMGYLG